MNSYNTYIYKKNYYHSEDSLELDSVGTLCLIIGTFLAVWDCSWSRSIVRVDDDDSTSSVNVVNLRLPCFLPLGVTTESGPLAKAMWLKLDDIW